MIKILQYTIHTNRPNHIGYVPSNLNSVSPALDKIVEKYLNNKTEKYAFVEPGCGLATVTEYMAKKYTWKQVLAIDDESSVLFLAKQRLKNKKLKIEFLSNNVLDLEIPKPAVVYNYLLSNIITKMYEKGILNGCLVVSLTFLIKDIEPTETIAIKGFQKNIYVYDFRKMNN